MAAAYVETRGGLILKGLVSVAYRWDISPVIVTN